MAIRRINPNENINLDQNQVIEPNVAIQQPKTTIRKLAPNESIMLDQERVQVPAYAADPLYYPQKPEDNSLSELLKFGATDAARRAYEYSGNITTQAADVADRIEYGARKFFYDLIGQPEPTPQIDTIQAPKQNWVSSKLTESADQDFANANILAGKVNEINAEPTVDWEQVKQDPVSMNTLRFMAEQGTISSPEMLMAMVPILGLPLIGSTTSQSIIEDRQRNLGKDPRSVTPEDFLFSSTIGLGSGGLERLGGLASAGLIGDAGRVTMSQIPRNALESGLEEAATEAIQNPLELVGSTVGTGQELTAQDLLDSSAQGALVGFGTGTVVRTGTDSVRALKNGITQQPMDNGGVTPNENALNPDIPLLPPPAPASPPVPNRDDLARMISAKPNATTEESLAVQPEIVKPPISGTPEIGDTIEHVDQYGQVIEGTIDSVQEGENGQRTLIVTDETGNQNIVFEGAGETLITERRPPNRDDLLSQIQNAPDEPVTVSKKSEPETLESLQADIDAIRANAKRNGGWNGMRKRQEQEAINKLSAFQQRQINESAAQANPEPTEAQKEAGNYKKGHINFGGLDIAIENPKGSARKGVDAGGTAWETTMPAHYGYVKSTNGADGDQVDVYIGSNPDAPEVFIVDQIDPVTGKFDEHKVMVGFNTSKEAGDAYKAAFSDGTGTSRVGAVEGMDMAKFKEWLKTGDTTKPLVYQEPAAPAPVVEEKPAEKPAPQPTADAMLSKTLTMVQEAIDSKNAETLRHVLGNLENKKSRAFFEEKTGIKLPKTKRDTLAAIDTFIGIDDVKRKEIDDQKAADFNKAKTDKEASSLEKRISHMKMDTGESVKEWVDKTIAGGHNKFVKQKNGTRNEYFLSNSSGNAFNLSKFGNPDVWKYAKLVTDQLPKIDIENVPTAQTAPKSQKPDKNNVQRLADVDKETAEKFANTVLEQAKGLEDEIRAYFKNANQDAPEKIKTIDRAISELLRNDKLGDNFKEQLRQIQYQAAPPVIPSEPVQESKPDQEVIYNGVRIYPLPVKSREEGSPPVQMWAVESAQNKERRESGERAGMGDTLHSTLDEAKKQADFDVSQREDAAKRDALNASKKKEEEDKTAAIKADTYNGFLDGKPENTKSLIRKALSKQYNFTDGGGVMTVRERIEKFNDNGTLKISTLEENKIKPMSKMQFHRADQKQQDAHEARVKEAGKKTTYLVNESELGKIGYDYAEYLIAQKSKPDQEMGPDVKTAENQPSEPENVPETPVSGPQDQEQKTEYGRDLGKDIKKGFLVSGFAKMNGETIISATKKDETFGIKTRFYNEEGTQLFGMQTYSGNPEDVVKLFDNITDYKPVKTTTEPQESAPEPAEVETPADKPKDTIEDFGEKIAGAKKDLWKDYEKAITDELPADIKDITLAKHFPEPNYEALIANGVTTDVLASIKAMRDIIPSKPQKSWKLKEWATKVQTVRKLSKMMLDGKYTPAEMKEKMSEYSNVLRGLVDRMEFYSALGYPSFTKAKDWNVNSSDGVYENGKKIEGTQYFASYKERYGDRFPTRQQAIDFISAKLAIEDTTKSKKPTTFEVYRITKTGEVVIGKKIATGKFINLKGGFKTGNEARLYLAQNGDELVALYEKKKDVPPERRSTNDPRRGEDYRNGEDVSVETLAKTFGFRGIQFGNYVEQKRRAADINNAYDAMKDMAAILGVPESALSLEGTLGLAFGARGGGNFAAAHYERGQTVINLTKSSGAGSLAHEWFHAFDHNFGKRREGKDVYITDSAYIPTKEIRKEVTDAFAEIVKAIKKTGVLKRSESIDKTRTKDYWSTDIEMAARSFEAYIIYKAGQKDASNDYLANVVGEDAWNASRDESKDNSTYPYPTEKEMSEKIAPAFDKLFDVLETKDTDKGAVMFSLSSDYEPSKTISKNAANEIIGKIVADLNTQAKKLGLPENSAVIFENISDVKNVPNLEKASQDGGVVEGFYYKNLIYIAMTAKDYISTLNHEAVHYLKAAGAFTQAEWDTLLEKAPKWREKYNIQKNYGDLNLTESKLDEEAIAHALQDYSNQGILTRIRNKIIKYFNMVKNVVTGKGFNYKTPEALFDDIMSGEIGRRRFDPEYDVEPMFSRKTVADGLQSTLVKAAENLKQAKGTGQQMLGILKNTDGVKEEEISWTGLDDFLVSKPTVSKQEIVDYLDQNQVRIEEVTLGDNRKEQYAITDNGDFFEDGYSTREEAENRRDELEQELDKTLYVEATEGTDSLTGETVTGNTKFSQYTLPGGENYREVLLTLPARDESKARMVFIEEDESYTVYDTEGKIYSTDLTEQEAKDELLGLGVNIDQVKSNFNSSHYDQPNILAHVRLNDRTDADGKKVLFVEEIQSDWHQAGRKKGYKSNKMPTPEEAKEYYAIRNSDWENMSSEEKQSYVNEMNADPDYIRAHVPDAPFKKSWHEMTFRRVVQMAAQEGYDSVAWTTGEMQNDRYDLSKQIKQIITERDDTGITLKAYDVDNKKVINKSGLKESDLEDYVGKDVAKRIVEQLDEGKEASPKRQKSDIRGDDLKVIGGGMKGFYDNILVKYANKFGKKFDAKVSDTNLSGANRLDQESQSYYGPIVREGELADEIEQDTLPSVSVKNQAKDVLEAMENGTSFNDAIAKFGSESLANHFGGKLIFTKENIKVHSMDITPAMREASEEGLPLFSRIGGIGKKKMSKEEQLEQAIASLDARGLADKLRPAISKIASYVLHPHQIASLYKSFTPVYLGAIEMMKTRDVLVHKLSDNITLYNKINKKSKARIDAVLELGRLSKQNYKMNADGKIVVKNEGYKDTLHSKDGDTITLSDVEAKAYQGVRDAMDLALDTYSRTILEEYGFVKMGLDNKQDLIKALSKEKNKSVIKQMQDVLRILQDIEDAKRKGYIPLKRWGEIGITVRTKGEDAELVHFERIELPNNKVPLIGRKNTVGENKAVIEAIKRLREKYPADTFAIDSFEVKDFTSLQAKIDLNELDVLAASSDMSEADYDTLREMIADAMKRRGFRQHFFQSNDVSGYDGDFERAINDYVVSISGHLSRRMHIPKLDAAIKQIIDTGEASIADYATKYVKYVTDPVEEFGAVRQMAYMWYLAGNVASGVTNASQPFMVTAPWFKAMFSHGQIAKQMAKAYKDATAMISLKNGTDVFDFSKAPDDVREALERANAEGYFIPLQTYDAMAIANSNSSYMRGTSRRVRDVMDVLSLTFSVPERTNRVVTYVSAYRFAIQPENKKKIMAFINRDQLGRASLVGKDGAEFAEAFADYAVMSTQLRMGKLNRPTLSRGAGTLPFQFMSFSLQMLELMYRLKKVHGGKGAMSIGMMMFAVVAMAGIKGIPFEDDLQKLFEAAYKKLTRTDIDIDSEMLKLLTNSVGKTAAQAIVKGIPYALANVDMSSRLGYGNIVPDGQSDLLGVWFDMFYTKPTQAATDIARGDELQAVANIAPAFIRNPIQAYLWAAEGVKSGGTGDTIIPPEDLTKADIGMKMFGFTSSSVSGERSRIYAEKRASTAANELRSDYYDRLARAYAGRIRASRNKDKEAELRYGDEIDAINIEKNTHNEDAPLHKQIIINDRTLKQRVVEEINGAKSNKPRKQARQEAEELKKVWSN